MGKQRGEKRRLRDTASTKQKPGLGDCTPRFGRGDEIVSAGMMQSQQGFGRAATRLQ